MLNSNENAPEAFSVVTPSAASGGVPQFSTAEYAHIPSSERCRICSGFLSGEYYRVNGQMACRVCALQASEGQPSDSHAAFARGLLLGAGAAILGLAVYATFTIVTGWYIGYLALGVGWLVAKAILTGSNNIGGRRYQVAAVLLTYSAISVAAIPILLASNYKHHHPRSSGPSSSSMLGPSATIPGQSGAPSDRPGSTAAPLKALPFQTPRSPLAAMALAFGFMLAIGLASPFLALVDPLHGAVGLFILFIGLRIAWRMTKARPLSVYGPYSATTP